MHGAINGGMHGAIHGGMHGAGMELAWSWHGALHGAYKEAAWSPVWRCTKMYASNHTGLHGGTKQVCMELCMEPYMEVCMEVYMEACMEP